MLDGPKLQEIEQLVNDELHPYRYQTTIIDHSDHQFTFAAPEKIEETEESTQDSTDDPQEKELPETGDIHGQPADHLAFELNRTSDIL